MYTGSVVLGKYTNHTAGPLVHDPSPYEFQIAIKKFKRHKSLGIHQIPAELIQAGEELLHSRINKLINNIWNKENCLIGGRNLLL
jgi:hypothetical protein